MPQNGESFTIYLLLALCGSLCTLKSNVMNHKSFPEKFESLRKIWLGRVYVSLRGHSFTLRRCVLWRSEKM